MLEVGCTFLRVLLRISKTFLGEICLIGKYFGVVVEEKVIFSRKGVLLGLRNLFVSAIFRFLPLCKDIAGSVELKASIHIHIGKGLPAFLSFYAAFVEIVLFKETSWLVLERFGIE